MIGICLFEFGGCMFNQLWELVVMLDDWRFFVVMELLSCGVIIEDIYVEMKIDLFFFYVFWNIIILENKLMEEGDNLFVLFLKQVKVKGFMDVMIVFFMGKMEEDICVFRKKLGIVLLFKIVDICVVEFDVKMNYFYFIYFGESDGDIS